MDFIYSLEPWHWMAFGVALLSIEVLIGTEILLGLGLGALVVALIHKLIPGLSWQMQLVWFAIFSVLLTVVYWKKFRASQQQSDSPKLNQRTLQLIGTITVLIEPIINGQGRVQIADAVWVVNGPALAQGAAVKVIAVEGMTLKVEPL